MKTGDFVKVNYLGVIFDDFPEYGEYEKYIKCRDAESKTWRLHNIINDKALLTSGNTTILAYTKAMQPV